MAWTEINHACGHNERVQLYGPGRDRERTATWIESKDCQDCIAAKLAEQSKIHAAVNSAAGLVALTGSAKQVAWAETIRAKMLPLLDKCVMPGVSPSNPFGVSVDDPRWASVIATMDALRDSYRTQSSAKWWIDNRESNLYGMWAVEMERTIRAMFALEIEAVEIKVKAAKDAEVQIRRAQMDAEIAAKRAQEQTDNDRSEAACEHFRVIRAERKGVEDFILYGEGNHEAKGCRMDGEWVVYSVDDLAVNTLLPYATALASKARGLLEVAYA